MKGQDILFSHKSDDYITPDWLMDELKQEFDFELDACSTNDNPTALPSWFNKNEDGLTQEWGTTGFWTYCNPPYSEVARWVEKAYHEWHFKGKSIVMLLPARTDTKWFHEYIYNKKGIEIRFIKGRLKFKGMKNSAPFPSMLVIFR